MVREFSPISRETPVLLAELIQELGDETATLIGGPADQRVVRLTEFHDTVEDLPEEADTLLLAPSVTTAQLEALAHEGARRGYAAIAVKAQRSDVDEMSALSRSAGIPLMRVTDRVSWRAFDARVAQALGERRYVDDTRRDRGAEPLFTLSNELAEFFGGSVAIEDLSRRIIAYSSVPGQVIDRLRTQGILTRQVPNTPLNDDQYRSVLRSEVPLKFPRLGDEEPRIAYPIHAGTLPLGTIWAIDPSDETEVTLEQGDRLRRAATIAASHMLDDAYLRGTTRVREDRLRTMLDGDQVTGSEFAALGISEERGGVLIVFALPHDERTPVVAQLRSLVQRHLAVHRPEAVTTVRGGKVYALLDDGLPRSAQDLVDPLLPIIDRLLGSGTQVALPGTARRSVDVAPLRALADRLFDAAGSLPPASQQRVLTASGLRAELLFARTSELFTELAELRSPELSRLMEHDPTIAQTLIAWFGALGNVARTARALGIHENTVRYRLERATNHYGLALDDSDLLLAAWLQLRSHRP